jgi:glycosyltransferase involved in cell wall biosynthesis
MIYNNITKEKVLIVSAWLPGGGVEKVILNLFIDNSPFKNLNVISLSKIIKYNWVKNFEDKVQFLDFFKSTSNSRMMLLYYTVKSAVTLNKKIKEQNPKYILVTHSFLLPVFLFIRGKRTILYWPHNNLLKSNKYNIVNSVFYFLFNSLIDGVLCVNSQIEKEAISCGFKNTKIVYNPIGEGFRNQFLFNPNMKKLCHIGFLDSRKNTEFIIDALALSGNKKLQLEIIGDGILLEYLKNKVNNLELNSQVKFKGFLDLDSIIIESSALIMASHTEGFSMIISDALKSGIPVILPKSLDISSYIETSKSGLIFDNVDLYSLAEILSNIDFRKYNNKKISSEYINFFGIQSYSKRVIDLLNRLKINYVSNF